MILKRKTAMSFVDGSGSHLRTTVRSSVDNLWRRVQRATTECLQKFVFMVQVGQAEISNLKQT